MLNILVNYVPASFSPDPLPVHMARISDEEARKRLESGLQSRTIIGIGHSLGGCATYAFLIKAS